MPSEIHVQPVPQKPQAPTSATEAMHCKDTQKKRLTENQLSVITHMCETIKIRSDLLLTEDIVGFPEFVTALSSMSTSFKEFDMLRTEWRLGQKFIKTGSEIGKIVSECSNVQEGVTAKLLDVSTHTVNVTNLQLQMLSCQRKMEAVTKAIPVLLAAKNNFESAIPPLQRALRCQRKRKRDKLAPKDQYTVLGSNSADLTWEAAIEKLSDIEVDLKPLSVDQLLQITTIKASVYHQGYCCLPLKTVQSYFSLSDQETVAARDQIIETFPMMAVTQGKNAVLLDYHELLLRPDTLYDLLTLDMDEEEAEDLNGNTGQCQPAEQEAVQPGIFYYVKTGPVPLEVLHTLNNNCTCHQL